MDSWQWLRLVNFSAAIVAMIAELCAVVEHNLPAALAAQMLACINGGLLLHNSHPPQASEPVKWTSNGIPRIDAETERLIETPRIKESEVSKTVLLKGE
jgi:hypothetical protein